MKRSYDRTERVADLIQKTLASMLLQGVHGEHFGFVTITSVQVSRDLSYAKVYISVLTETDEKIKETINALNRAAKSLRYELAQSVKLRIIPKLKFVYDESTARGFRISNLIDAAIKKKE